MSLPEILKQLLVCPKCKGALRVLEAQHEIHCEACRLVFAIEDDVPNLLLSDARPLKP